MVNQISTIKVRRREWAGHVVRMSDNMNVKKVFPGKPEGKKKRRRTKIRVLKLC